MGLALWWQRGQDQHKTQAWLQADYVALFHLTNYLSKHINRLQTMGKGTCLCIFPTFSYIWLTMTIAQLWQWLQLSSIAFLCICVRGITYILYHIHVDTSDILCCSDFCRLLLFGAEFWKRAFVLSCIVHNTKHLLMYIWGKRCLRLLDSDSLLFFFSVDFKFDCHWSSPYLMH